MNRLSITINRKKHMAQTDIEQLIAAELLGETLSAEERRQLDAWLDEEPAHREQYARIRMARFSAARYDAYRQINADRAYHDFLKKTRRASRRKLYMQIAAACLVPLFIIAGSIWVKHYDKAPSEPVAAIMPFDTEEEAISLANDTCFGLASYLFARDLGRIWRVSEALQYGMVGINDVTLAAAETPFGGVKFSGMGREGSREGLNDYMETHLFLMGGIDN